MYVRHPGDMCCLTRSYTDVRFDNLKLFTESYRSFRLLLRSFLQIVLDTTLHVQLSMFSSSPRRSQAHQPLSC